MPRQEWSLIRTYPSSSNPSVTYEVRKGADGVVYCTCPRWRFLQGRGNCKHVDQVLAQIKPRTECGRKDIISCSQLQAGDVVEVNSNGNVFLLKVQVLTSSHVQGIELLDPNTPRSSLRGERFVHIRDVVRVVVPARAR